MRAGGMVEPYFYFIVHFIHLLLSKYCVRPILVLRWCDCIGMMTALWSNKQVVYDANNNNNYIYKWDPRHILFQIIWNNIFSAHFSSLCRIERALFMTDCLQFYSIAIVSLEFIRSMQYVEWNTHKHTPTLRSVQTTLLLKWHFPFSGIFQFHKPLIQMKYIKYQTFRLRSMEKFT